MKETMAKSHIRQPNRNRTQILDECETELSSQSGNEVRETHITGHGWDEHEADSACHNNNTKQYGITKATLAQYQTCGGDDQQGTIDKTESRPLLPHWIHLNDSL